MNTTTTPLSQRLENLIATDFRDALDREDALEKESRRHDAAWKARMDGYPIRLYLDKLYMAASGNGIRPCRQSAFAAGLQLAFGAIADLAERQAAKGDPALEDALQRLDRRQFEADVPELRRVTMSNLLDWRTKYPPFLIALRLSLSHHLAARKRLAVLLPTLAGRPRARERLMTSLVEKLALHDGVLAMTSWVVRAVSRQDGEQGQSA